MHAHFGIDLSEPGALDRVTWRWLRARVAALPSDSALAAVLRERRRTGDLVPDQVLDSDEAADLFWRQRAPKHLRGGVH